MGPGAVFAGMVAEVALPTVVLFALCYVAMVGRRRYGKVRGLLAFLAAFLSGGFAYAITCVALHIGPASHGGGSDMSMVLILVLPLLFSAAAIWLFSPRKAVAAGAPEGE